MTRVRPSAATKDRINRIEHEARLRWRSQGIPPNTIEVALSRARGIAQHSLMILPDLKQREQLYASVYRQQVQEAEPYIRGILRVAGR